MLTVWKKRSYTSWAQGYLLVNVRWKSIKRLKMCTQETEIRFAGTEGRKTNRVYHQKQKYFTNCPQ